MYLPGSCLGVGVVKGLGLIGSWYSSHFLHLSYWIHSTTRYLIGRKERRGLSHSPAKIVLFDKIIHKHLLEQRIRLLLRSLSETNQSTRQDPSTQLTFNLSCPGSLSNSNLASSLCRNSSALTPFHPIRRCHYLESHRKPHIPHTIPLDIRQIERRVQRLASLGHSNQKLLMRFV
jgi:hypothetical protein